MADRGRARRRRLARLFGVASVALLVVAAGCAATSASPSPSPAPSPVPPTHSGGGQWTGLQWREVTAVAGEFFSHREPPYGQTQCDPAEIVVWSGGLAMIGGDDRSVWVSKDGLRWIPSPGSPQYAGLISWNGMLIAGGFADGGDGLWTSTDASIWHQAPIPFDFNGCQQSGVCYGLAVGRPGIMAVTIKGGPEVIDPGIPYLSTDGVTWNPAPLPDEATDVRVERFFDGFIAFGGVASSPSDPFTRIGRSWVSGDGLHWSRYVPAVPTPLDGLGPWDAVTPWDLQAGPAGWDNGEVRSTDGLTWTLDTMYFPGAQWLSDGDRIVAAQTWLARFYLSEGDGTWVELEQGGDIGQLPAGGRAYLLPDGLLWVAGERVFFGEALSGVHPSGSLVPWTPSPTPWPGPT
jgi:hypothetical protein